MPIVFSLEDLSPALRPTHVDNAQVVQREVILQRDQGGKGKAVVTKMSLSGNIRVMSCVIPSVPILGVGRAIL
jgi:hypothetical protein